MLPEAEWRLFAACRCAVAEGPRWNPAERRLYWVDIPRGRVYRMARTGNPEAFELFDPGIGKIGALTFLGEELLLFGAGCRVWRCRFGGTPELFAELPGRGNTRFNDVLADDAGHIYCGVAWNPAAEFPGELWRFSLCQRRFDLLAEGFRGMPNGMGISPDRRRFYLAVSEEHRIICCDFCEEEGRLGEWIQFAEFAAGQGNPDGMAVEAESGNVLVAFWDGGALRTFSPSGVLLKEEHFPIGRITSVTEGDGEIFLTTGTSTPEEKEWLGGFPGSIFLRKKDDGESGWSTLLPLPNKQNRNHLQ